MKLLNSDADRLVKVSILVNGAPVEALSLICHKEKAENRTRAMLAEITETN